MLKKPAIADATLLAAVRDRYGLSATGIEFLALGYDINAGVYRITTTAADYFLKVKTGAIYPPAVIVPRSLYDRGLRQIVTPLPARDGSLITTVEQFNLILYPYIEHHTASEIGLTDDQWREFGAIVRQIHDTPLPQTVTLDREAFAPSADWRRIAHATHARIRHETYTDPEQIALAEAWRTHYDAITELLRRADAYGQHLRERDLPHVLCHADLHTGNLLIDAQGQLFVVDWDQPVVAPKERDLMFISGGRVITAVSQQQEVAFFDGYGQTDIDREALIYYRAAWVVQDIGGFAEQVFLLPDLSVEAKREAIRYFVGSFAPDSIAESALQ